MKIEGKDNYGRPRQAYVDKVTAMDDQALSRECYEMIYQSARCNNNPRADWHWMVDACLDICKERGKPEIYSDAWKRCVKDYT